LDEGFKDVIVPFRNASEAAVAGDPNVQVMANLGEVGFL
jgi:hypothetical protein